MPFVGRVQAMDHMKQVYQITTQFSKGESMFITLYEGGILVDGQLVGEFVAPFQMHPSKLCNRTELWDFLSVGHVVEKVCYVDSV